MNVTDILVTMFEVDVATDRAEALAALTRAEEALRDLRSQIESAHAPLSHLSGEPVRAVAEACHACQRYATTSKVLQLLRSAKEHE